MRCMRFLIVAMLALPFVSNASSIFGTLPFLPEEVFSGASVVSVSEASVSTGGQVVTGGKSVSTDDGIAEVSITNVINASNGGGTSKTVIRTNTNGVTAEEVYEKSVGPGEQLEMKVSTSTRSGTANTKAKSDVRADGEREILEIPVVSAETEASSATQREESALSRTFLFVSKALSNIFSIFRFW